MRRLILGIGILSFFYILSIFAPVIAPYDYRREDREMSYCPPQVLRFFDGTRLYLRPFVYPYVKVRDEDGLVVYKEDRSRKIFLQWFYKGHLFGFKEKKMVYLLGSDSRGRDYLSRLIFAGRISLSIGLIGAGISFFIGMLVGGIAGYFGGWIDNLLMRISEMVMLIPGFYLMLALRAVFPLDMDSRMVYLMMVVIMSFIGWASLSRVIRGQVLSIARKVFVLSARAIGMSDVEIIFRHVLPHTLSYVLVAITLSIPGYILGESALSLLGLGIQEPYVSWGNMLSSAMNIAQIYLHPWVLCPGAAIFLVVMGYNLLGDGLRDVLGLQTI